MGLLSTVRVPHLPLWQRLPLVKREATEQAPTDESVTVIVSRKIKPEFESDYKAWVQATQQLVQGFPGYQGVKLLTPAETRNNDYVVIYRFDTYENLNHWANCAERAARVKLLEPWLAGETHVETLSGMEFWFDMRGTVGMRPPKKWKMLLTSAIGLYPLVLFVLPSLQEMFGFLPALLAPIPVVLAMLAIMTYGIMPVLTRVMRRWLFPQL